MSSNVNFYLANVRGALSVLQLSDLHSLLPSADFFALTETHLDSSVPDGALTLPGWAIVRRDRSRYGGGVALLFRNSFLCTPRLDLQSPSGEDLWTELTISGKKVIIATIYRPPSQSADATRAFIDALDVSLGKALSENSILVMLGDFNAKHSDWLQLPGSPTDLAGSSLSNLTNSFNLSQLVSDVTRPSGGQGLPSDNPSGSLLDLIFTNRPDLLSQPKIEPPLGSSDHFAVRCSISTVAVPRGRPIRRLWNLKKANIEAFLADLSAQRWPCVGSSASPDAQWESWSSAFHDCARRHVPSKLVRHVQPKPAWLSDRLLAECKLKKALFRICKLHPTADNLLRYRVQRNKTTALLRRAKKEFSSDLEDSLRRPSSRGQDFWSFVRRVKGSKEVRPIPPLLQADGSLATSDKAKADVLNAFFIRQSALPSRDDPPTVIDRYSSSTSFRLSSLTVSEAEVFALLSTLNVRKAPGMDGISNNILRAAAPAIAGSLAVLFQNSLNAGRLPSAWKVQKIKPIHKRGPRNSPDNYRPISLLSSVVKVLETIVNRRLYAHLDSQHLLSSFQSGFRRGDSPSLQLFRLTHSMMSAVDSGSVVGAVFYDIRKAFDTVWHAALLRKLSLAGISGSLLSWFSDFLTTRSQQVEVGSQLSSPASPLAGVPQGSVLSPTLFLLFIDSVTSVTSSPSNCFADDTSTFVFSPSPAEAEVSLQADVNSVSSWAKAHKLSFHPSKTVCMLFHHPRRPSPPLSIFLDGQAVSCVQSHRHLGLTLSATFSWSCHVDSIIKKASSMLGLMRLFRFAYHFSSHSLLRIYLNYIRPSVEYCCTSWSGLPPSLARRLEAIQRSALAIAGLPPDFLPSLSSRRSAELARFFRKLLSNDVPDHLSNFCSWPSVADASGRSLRSSSSVRLPRPNTSLLLSSPLFLAASAYNASL